jgi:hypothetical protein
MEVNGRWIYDDGLYETFKAPYLGCPTEIGDKFHDARVITNSVPIEPGHTYTLPILFLYPDLVRPKLSVGLKFLLKKGFRLNYGEAEILEICEENPRIN